ncbi:MAG: hypothetical protein KGL39_22240 [Patescibacteria group bacterium]|nr:hypothetical protein [Patescibacteria group bacterium]
MSAIKHRNGIGRRSTSLGTTAAIILIVVAFVTGVIYVTKPLWHRFLYPTTSITVPVSKPRVTQVKHPTKPTTPTKPAQPTQPTQPSPTQTFPMSAITPIGEQILGNPYWKNGTLVESPADSANTSAWERSFFVAFTLPVKTQLRSPIDGVVSVVETPTGTSPGFYVQPTSSLMSQHKGVCVLYAGNALHVLVKDGQSVTKGEVVAVVSNPDITLLMMGKVLNGNVLVSYLPYVPQVAVYSSPLSAVQEAFPYISEPK